MTRPTRYDTTHKRHILDILTACGELSTYRLRVITKREKKMLRYSLDSLREAGMVTARKVTARRDGHTILWRLTDGGGRPANSQHTGANQ